MTIPRLCINCKNFVPNAGIGWCFQFYKRILYKRHEDDVVYRIGIQPRDANYCRNIEKLCGKDGKFFVPYDKIFNKNHPKIQE